ncbi:MAG: CDP-alcohol phosphatidyltransferase family protein [Thermoprotei archaeon]
MLTKFRKRVAGVVQAMAYPFIRFGVSPNAITVCAFVLSLVAAVLIVEGQYLWAFVPFALGSLLDGLDGSVARALGRATQFGSFLDSSLDRYSDGVVIGGFLMAFSALPARAVTLAALLGSFLVSYSRAKGESLGLKMEGVGIGERAERLMLVAIALLFSSASLVIMAILAIVSNFTYLQRLWEIRKGTQGKRFPLGAS